MLITTNLIRFRLSSAERAVAAGSMVEVGLQLELSLPFSGSGAEQGGSSQTHTPGSDLLLDQGSDPDPFRAVSFRPPDPILVANK